jgi:hypothetical protein
LTSELTCSFKAVRDSVVGSMGHYQIWFALIGEGKGWEKHLDDMNDHRVVDFFKGTIIAHYRMMFIELACLFDSVGTAHGIRDLKSKMKEAGLTSLADKFDVELQPFSTLVSNIKTVRSKIIAHRDVGVDYKDLYQKHGIKPDDIGRLLETTSLLMRELEEAIKGEAGSSTVGPTDRWERATLGTLELLRAGRSSKQGAAADH